jgi:hypothetical protein
MTRTMQPNLFDPPPVPGKRPTSHQAARAIAPHAKTLRGQVYAFLVQRGPSGATDEEIQRALGMTGNTQRPRRQELETQGLVVDSGVKRPTAAGRDAVVWVLRTAACL